MWQIFYGRQSEVAIHQFSGYAVLLQKVSVLTLKNHRAARLGATVNVRQLCDGKGIPALSSQSAEQLINNLRLFNARCGFESNHPHRTQGIDYRVDLSDEKRTVRRLYELHQPISYIRLQTPY